MLLPREQLTLLPLQAVLTGHPETFCFFLGELMNVFIECINERLLWSENSEPFLEPWLCPHLSPRSSQDTSPAPGAFLLSSNTGSAFPGSSQPHGGSSRSSCGTAQRCQGCASPSLGTASPSLSMGRNSRRAVDQTQGCPLLSASISRVGAAWVVFFIFLV